MNDIINVMFVAFVIGAMVRVMDAIEKIKKYGVENVKVPVIEHGSSRTAAYKTINNIMTIPVNICVILLWLYVNFWS